METDPGAEAETGRKRYRRTDRQRGRENCRRGLEREVVRPQTTQYRAEMLSGSMFPRLSTFAGLLGKYKNIRHILH